VRKPIATLAVLALLLHASAHAAEVWDAAPFATPAAQLLQAATAVKREHPVDIVVLLDERIFVLDEQHRLTSTQRMIYRVDSPDGVERWAASSAQWQPWHQARPEIRARVVTTDGQEHQLDQKLLNDSGTRDTGEQVYDDDHVLEGPLPAIAIGAVVEEEIVLRDEKPFFSAGAVYREYIGRPVPVLHTRVIIDAPESLPLKRITQLLPNAQGKETRANGRVRWTLELGTLEERREMESNLPSDVPAWSSVEFSTGASWEAVAAGYRDMTEARIRENDAKPLLVGLKLPGTGTNRDYIAKIVERVHREVRYTGVEFGAARLVPEFPSETLRRKFGDCKDKSTLLVAALRASGVDAYLALLSAGDGQDVAPDLPGLGMFDHAIVYVPSHETGTPDLWIDATAEYARVGTLPAADADRLALVIRAGEKALMRTPAMRSTDNLQIETREFFLGEYGPARVVETTETRGTIEAEYRAWYAGADTKERLDTLKTYAHDAYRAKALANYEHTASTDFSKFYSMSLEMKDAPVGSTDLTAAVVGVNVANITGRLPDYFDEQLEEEDESKPAAKRTADVVIEPFVNEWRYRIQPPPGFKARQLPANNVLKLGPTQLRSEFSVGTDGVVTALWRFDTVKSRFTPAESDALVKGLRSLKAMEVQLISFDQIGAALRAEGDYKGALQAYQSLIAQHPKQAMHRLRNAYALLDAGLGARAQREAQVATKLEPKNAFAWKVHGWMLQHDSVGRRFGTGYDRAGAIASYRKARQLDPENTDIAADLAVLYEHDVAGTRYTDKSNLDLAIVEYQARRKLLSEEEAKDDQYSDNLFYALLFAHRYADLREALRDETPNATRRALAIAAIAATDGGPKAIEASRELVSGEVDRRAALSRAGSMLTNLREYPAAADLLEASTRGQTTTAANTQRIAALRKTTRNDGKSIAATDPQGAVLRAFAELVATDKPDATFSMLLSRRSQSLADADADLQRARRMMVVGLARRDIPFDVGVDLLFSNLRVNVEGDDTQGFRVQLRTGGPSTPNFYVVKEDGAYRILAVAPMVAPLGIMALERVDAGDLAGARRWLDWAKLEMHVANSEDPLEGYAFARAWTVGAETNLAAARTAAALLLADFEISERAVPLLNAARAGALDSADKVNIDLALAHAHSDLSQWALSAEAATRLVAAVPSSAVAFNYQQWARIQLKQWDAVEAAARERLTRLPDDSIARKILMHRAEARGTYADISGILQPLIDSGRATPSDYNEYAWASLLLRPVSDQAVEAARMAFDETQGRSFPIAHTLACVYAATGKPREARDLLLKGMEQVGIDTPNDSTWYGFGLVAEAYGDAESARDYYGRVQKPKKGVVLPGSVYSLSQARIAALR
jgi:transglutaminase-like putative cysteine protease